MNKQVTIIIALIATVIIAATASYILSLHKVDITLKDADMAGSILRYGEEEDDDVVTVTTVDDSKSVKLQDGSYGYLPNNTKYDSTPLKFEVAGKDTSIEINPDYSKERLATLLQDELPNITPIITTAYGQVLDSYDIKPGSLYKKGEWYGTTIIEHAEPGGNYGDTYRVILRKIDGNWKIEASPSLVLTTHDNPTIPKEILTSVNNL